MDKWNLIWVSGEVTLGLYTASTKHIQILSTSLTSIPPALNSFEICLVSVDAVCSHSLYYATNTKTSLSQMLVLAATPHLKSCIYCTVRPWSCCYEHPFAYFSFYVVQKSETDTELGNYQLHPPVHLACHYLSFHLTASCQLESRFGQNQFTWSVLCMIWTLRHWKCTHACTHNISKTLSTDTQTNT